MVVAVSVLGVFLVLAGAAICVLLLRLRSTTIRVRDLERAAVEEERELPLPRSVQAAERAIRSVIGTAVRVREQGVGGMVLSSMDDLSRWAMEDRSEIERLAAADGSVTVLFTDIEGSTSMNDELGDEGWVQLLIAHDTMVRAQVERRQGHVVKSQGDGFMIVFGTPANAVKAGLDIQRSFSDTWSRRLRRQPISVRIGIHSGTVVARAGDYFGLNVAIAARVGAEAGGGETLVTETVARELGDDPRFVLRRSREVELKGVPGDHVLHTVSRASRRA